MKILFNGTGASEGFPAVFCQCEHCKRARAMGEENFRTRNSCLIDQGLLIDFSPDTYTKSLYGKLDLTKVKTLIITHSHADHLYAQDLCKIMPPYAEHVDRSSLQVYGNQDVGRVLESAGAIRPGMHLYLQFNLLEEFTTNYINGYEIIPLPANHDPKQACYIYVVKKGKKTILYGHDSGYFSDGTWAAFKNFRFDAVILDCTSGGEECPYPSHMGIPDNIKVRERMYKEGIADKETIFILTHFAHTFAPFYDRMRDLASKKGFVAAYDGFEIKI